MPVLDSDHLFDQAADLLMPKGRRPRQANLRRAISSAYYAVFHLVVSWAADTYAGGTSRQTERYRLIYRSIDHAVLKQQCRAFSAPRPSPALAAYVPAGIDTHMRAFAKGFLELQEKRHDADYDPLFSTNTADASNALAVARDTARRFKDADRASREAFLALILFKSRVR